MRRLRLQTVACLWLASIVCAGDRAIAADQSPPPPALAKTEVVATVGSEPICAGELDRWMRTAVRGRKVGPESMAWIQAQTLEEIVDRRLALAYGRRHRYRAVG